MRHPFQQRVVEEQAELESKRQKLAEFLTTGLFEELPEQERVRMHLQLHYMQMYSDVLGERIAAFKQ